MQSTARREAAPQLRDRPREVDHADREGADPEQVRNPPLTSTTIPATNATTPSTAIRTALPSGRSTRAIYAVAAVARS